MAPGAGASHGAFAAGDVLVGAGSGKVQWRDDGGVLHNTLTPSVSSPSTTGMAFDLADNLYVTGYTSNAISRFNATGNPIGTFGDGFNSHPESIAFDTFGNAYVGQEGGSRDILKFGPAGNLLAALNAAPDGKKGTDRLDVSGDQCTIYYTGQSKAVRRFDACANTQMPTFVSNLPGREAFDVKVLVSSDPNVDGDVLVADTQSIVRVDASGAILSPQYDAAGENCWTALAITTSPTTFWAGDRCTSNLYRFDLSSPSPILGPINVGPKTSLQGLAVNGGLTAATAADVSVVIADEPDPVSPSSPTEPTFVHYPVAVTNNGHGLARAVTFNGSVTGGTVHSAEGQDWTCQFTTSTVTCTLAQLGIDSTAPIDLVVQTALGATEVSLSGQVTANEPDPDLTNNAATESTSVQAQQVDHIISFCPSSGCTFDTDPFNAGPNNTDNTITRFQGAGQGGVVFVDEFFPPGPVQISCGSDDSSQLIIFDVPPGHDADNPAVVTATIDNSSGVGGGNVRPCTEDKLTGVDFEIPFCLEAGVAEPSPCLDSVTGGGGRVQTVTLWTSGDPPFRH